MSETDEYLLASFDYHLARGVEPVKAWFLACADYAFVYGPDADPERTPLSLAAERALEYVRGNERRVSPQKEIDMTDSVVYGAADECIAAVLSFLEYHEEHVQTEDPQAVHWTITKLLEAGRSYRDAVVEPDEVKRVWHEFWQPLVTSETTHVASLDQIQRELYDYFVMMGEVSKVYDAVTGGRVSKPNTCAEAVISEFDDYLNSLVEEAVKDELEALGVEENDQETVQP